MADVRRDRLVAEHKTLGATLTATQGLLRVLVAKAFVLGT
jgi:hypothetical protein